jgi:hypothetical protein
MNLGERTNAVKIRASRHFDARVELSHDAEQFFRTFERIKKRERAFPAHRQRHYGAREKNGVSHGKNRELFWNDPSLFGHVNPLGHDTRIKCNESIWQLNRLSKGLDAAPRQKDLSDLRLGS